MKTTSTKQLNMAYGQPPEETLKSLTKPSRSVRKSIYFILLPTVRNSAEWLN